MVESNQMSQFVGYDAQQIDLLPSKSSCISINHNQAACGISQAQVRAHEVINDNLYVSKC